MRTSSIFDVYAHNFGLVIPMKTGFLWEQQTDGVCCNHVQIEGVYIPLQEPRPYDELTKTRRDLLDELTTANYDYRSADAVRIWEDIKKELASYFEYEEVDAPEGQPSNEEGLQWIKITKSNLGFSWRDFQSLVGKTVALYYPNCD
jgi:hypothetical protein